MHGQIYNKRVYVKNEDEKEKLRIGGGSWTIKIDELTDEIELIVYITDKGKYGIKRARAEEKGFVRTFNGEEKLVVPVKEWRFIPNE